MKPDGAASTGKGGAIRKRYAYPIIGLLPMKVDTASAMRVLQQPLDGTTFIVMLSKRAVEIVRDLHPDGPKPTSWCYGDNVARLREQMAR